MSKINKKTGYSLKIQGQSQIKGVQWQIIDPKI